LDTSILAIAGHVKLRPCNVCGEPVVTSMVIDGVETVITAESEPLSRHCSEYHG
jgi:hypothetical protein